MFCMKGGERLQGTDDGMGWDGIQGAGENMTKGTIRAVTYDFRPCKFYVYPLALVLLTVLVLTSGLGKRKLAESLTSRCLLAT